MNKFYAGIGSRQTPLDIQSEMTDIARGLWTLGYTLRSGAAEGADEAFERGSCDRAEIYLPWANFRQRQITLVSWMSTKVLLPPNPKWASSIARLHHPAWDKLSIGARALMTRNTCQVLGPPRSEFIVCWTPEGKPVGGTGQALRIAKAHNIPVFNLAVIADRRALTAKYGV
jgi:hypothetical protein